MIHSLWKKCLQFKWWPRIKKKKQKVPIGYFAHEHHQLSLVKPLITWWYSLFLLYKEIFRVYKSPSQLNCDLFEIKNNEYLNHNRKIFSMYDTGRNESVRNSKQIFRRVSCSFSSLFRSTVRLKNPMFRLNKRNSKEAHVTHGW